MVEGWLVEQMKNGEGTCVKGGLVGKCLVLVARSI